MECRVKWTGDGMSFIAETGSNHSLVMDGAPDAGGRNLAPRPMEMLLAGTGGCTAFDVVMILKKYSPLTKQHLNIKDSQP